MSKVWWIGLIIAVMLLLIFLLSGCLDPPYGGPESRLPDSIKIAHYNNERPDGEILSESERPQHVYICSAAWFCYADGTMCTIGGLKADAVSMSGEYKNGGYWYPTDLAQTKGQLVCNENGYMTFCGKNDLWNGCWVKTNMQIIGKRTELATISFDFDTQMDPRTNFMKPVPYFWYNHGLTWGDLTYYLTGAFMQSHSNATETISHSNISPCSTNGLEGSNLSAENVAFLNDDSQTETMGIVSYQWTQQQGLTGNGCLKEATDFCLLDYCDTEKIKFFSTPYYCCMHLIGPFETGTKWPCELTGTSIGSILIEAQITVSCENRHILKTDAIVPVNTADFTLGNEYKQKIYDRWTPANDPNDPAVHIVADLFWQDFVDDPNAVTVNENGIVLSRCDPNRLIDVWIIPFESGQTPAIRPLDLSEVWLSTDPGVVSIMDKNNDGIINLCEF